MNIFKLFFRKKRASFGNGAPLFFYNTLAKDVQRFELPAGATEVRMYNCGPTVYGKQHIGNLSMFVFTDVLRKVLEYNGFPVKQVINITDFGHLTSDADEGEDKMTKGLKAEKMKVTMENMKALGEKYTEIFLGDIRALGVDTGTIEFPRASAYIPAQIAMIRTLEEKGYTYTGKAGVYFDTTKFPDYGKLGNIDLAGLKEGARVTADSEKRHPTDFILWKSDKKMGWDSPWGKGFPGWHIECSAMINSTLGKQIDIHTGGIEHIPVHHNNEIAQSESATGKKPLSRFWLHRAHIQIEGTKIAKSLGNVVYLSDIIERGYHPLALRYLFLGAHYRTGSNFTWEALEASQRALAKLAALRLSIKEEPRTPPPQWVARFNERINDDLDTPGALATLWEMTGDHSLSPGEILAGLIAFDRVLGLNLAHPDQKLKELAAPEMREAIAIDALADEVKALVREREAARSERNWTKSDEIRSKLEEMGYLTEDSQNGTKIFRK